MKKIINLLLLFIVTVLSSKAQIAVYAGWEEGDVFQNIFWKGSICTAYGASISDSFARKGTKSVRFELRATDTICGASKRAELYIPCSDSSQDIVWYAWSEYMPDNYAYDSHNELHFQLHDPTKFGPPLLGLWVTADRWKLVHTFDTADVEKRKPSIKQYDLGPVTKGVWVDWVLYANFKLDENGKIKLWRNGELLLDMAGANFNREKGQPQKQPYVKFGIYKWPWKDYTGPFNPDRRVLYFDEFKTGKEGSTLDDFIIKDQKENKEN